MIKENVKRILEELPPGVKLVAAAKTRSANEILEAIEAGVKIIGENYVQEAERIQLQVANRLPAETEWRTNIPQTDKINWHFIGHLQKNKVKRAIELFDMIESVDSLTLGEEINKICGQSNKIIPILIEVNSGREKRKFGVLPENVQALIERLSCLPNVKIMGLMTMGPSFGNPEEARPYFRATKRIFEELKTKNLDNMDPVRKPHSPECKTSSLATERVSKFSNGVNMHYLSMGMSNSYRVAIEEGANIVRIGSGIFGEREQNLDA